MRFVGDETDDESEVQQGRTSFEKSLSGDVRDGNRSVRWVVGDRDGASLREQLTAFGCLRPHDIRLDVGVLLGNSDHFESEVFESRHSRLQFESDDVGQGDGDSRLAITREKESPENEGGDQHDRSQNRRHDQSDSPCLEFLGMDQEVALGVTGRESRVRVDHGAWQNSSRTRGRRAVTRRHTITCTDERCRRGRSGEHCRCRLGHRNVVLCVQDVGKSLDGNAVTEATEFVAYRFGGRVSTVRVLGEKTSHDRFECPRDIGGEFVQRCRILVHLLVGDGERCVTDEGRAAGDHFVENDTE